jgi:hypothetical protein
VEERPEPLQREEWVNNLTPAVMFDYMKVWEQRQKRDDKGEEMFRRDMDLPTKQLDGGPDNCKDLLHQAR